MRSFAFAIALSTLGIVFGSTPATAGITVGLTGFWQGSFTCKAEDANGKETLKSGTVIPSAGDANEGAGALIACGTSDNPASEGLNEVETIHWKIDPSTESGTIKTSGAFSVNGAGVATCKGSWRARELGVAEGRRLRRSLAA